MLSDIIQNAVEARRSLSVRSGQQDVVKTLAAEPFSNQIPTLKSGIYRSMSPMLAQRFESFGRWEKATHGDWLSLSDMARLWDETIKDKRIAAIKRNRVAAEENWPNEASALFRPERLSLFAGHTDMNEKIYLLWLDFEDEPELWVYDSNGESRYKNIRQYLDAYLNDDISAFQRTWRA